MTQDLHRFANLSYVGQFAAKKGLTIPEIIEVIAFDRDDVIKELMEGPFRRKPSLGNKFGCVSRFSNGDWPIFYAAVGRETAQEESVYHYARKAAGNMAARAVHYSIVRSTFSGDIMNFCLKSKDWPDLTSNDYTFCNKLGWEAQNEGLDGFRSPSARHEGGTTAPVFKAETLSGPVIEATATLRFDATGKTIAEIIDHSP